MKRLMKAALLTLALTLLALSGFAEAQEQQASANASTLPPQPSPAPARFSAQPDPSYVIGVDDLLHIAVWEEPEFSTTLAVRTDGKISLPLLDDVQASGLTPMQLAANLKDKLKQFVDDPQVTVVVSRMKQERVYMVGEVLHSGPIALTPHMTVLEALVTAGFTPFANTKKVYVLRTVNGNRQKMPVNYKKMIKGDNADQDIVLQPGDVIVVP